MWIRYFFRTGVSLALLNYSGIGGKYKLEEQNRIYGNPMYGWH